jgi:ABC-type transport system involved in multi-copper enzyme maturation permease subunit
VNRTLITSFWLQRIMSPIRMVLAFTFFAWPLLFMPFMPQVGTNMLTDGTMLSLVFAVGMIGQDVSSGVLQLVFARPVRRAEYVISRWLSAAIAAGALGVAQVLIGALILASRSAGLPAGEIASLAAQRVLESVGFAAVFALFSALVGGVGDLGIYVVATLTSGAAQVLGGAVHQPAIDRAATELMGFLTPRLDLRMIFATSPMPWFPIVSYASTITLCLALAIVVMNRKELSYAST